MWENGSWFPNTPFGIVCWIIKYIGFIMTTVGLIRITNLWKKSQQRWKDIRSGAYEKKLERKKEGAAKEKAKEDAAKGNGNSAPKEDSSKGQVYTVPVQV